MMQFTETFAPSPPPAFTARKTVPRSRPWLGFPTNANCMEQLLVHCATAIESNDATLAQQILWVLNNIAAPDGDSGQRLTCGFLRALITRATTTGNCNLLPSTAAGTDDENPAVDTHRFSIIELAGFVDLTPWHRFGFTAANAAVLEAVEGYAAVHIVDLSLTHCMQIPTLIDALATRANVPPFVRLTVAGGVDDFPPMLDVSYEELGSKLVNFARLRNVSMEFRSIPSSCSDGFASFIEELRVEQRMREKRSEALVINCQMLLHYVSEDEENTSPNTTSLASASSSSSMVMESFSLRNMFLKEIRNLDPTLVVLVDEDADFTSPHLVHRLLSAYNYLWIPYDTMDTFLPRGSKQRQWYEADISWKIENVISHEGAQRVERPETKSKWVRRMRSAGYRGVAFSEDAITEVKNMLEEHAAGWGMKKEEEEHMVLTWKGHNVVFATVWVPDA